MNGSHVELVFPGPIPSLKSAEIRRMLAPIFDFEKHSASDQYVDRLPEPVRKPSKSSAPLRAWIAIRSCSLWASRAIKAAKPARRR